MSVLDFHRSFYLARKLQFFIDQQFIDTELLKDFLLTFGAFLKQNPSQVYNEKTFIKYLDLIHKIGSSLTTTNNFKHIKIFIHLLLQFILLFDKLTLNAFQYMCNLNLFDLFGRIIECPITLPYLKPIFTSTVYTFCMSALNIPITKDNPQLNQQLLYNLQNSHILDKCYKQFSEIGMPESLASSMMLLNKSMMTNTNIGNIDPKTTIQNITRYFNALSNQLLRTKTS